MIWNYTHNAVLEKIREGQEDAKKGNLIEHDEVEKKFSKCLK